MAWFDCCFHISILFKIQKRLIASMDQIELEGLSIAEPVRYILINGHR